MLESRIILEVRLDRDRMPSGLWSLDIEARARSLPARVCGEFDRSHSFTASISAFETPAKLKRACRRPLSRAGDSVPCSPGIWFCEKMLLLALGLLEFTGVNPSPAMKGEDGTVEEGRIMDAVRE